MLDYTPQSALEPGALTHTERHRFAFGGVAFEVLAAEGEPFTLPWSYRRFFLPVADAPVIADVVCSVAIDPGRSKASWSGPHRSRERIGAAATRVETAELRAEITQLSPRRFAVAARCAPTSDAVGALLLGVVSEVVQAAGGLALHATAVEVDAGAVLLLGPSGAGKTTGAAMIENARVFANDRVVVTVGERGPLVWPLAGGNPAQLPESEQALLPLRALLRVRRGAGAPVLARASGVESAFIAREAAITDGDPQLERLCLDAIGRVVAEVPVATVHTVLGTRFGARLAQLLMQTGRPSA